MRREFGRLKREFAASLGRSKPGKVFEDRKYPGNWRVEKFDDDGGAEVAIFGGPRARQRAIEYADWRYGEFEEVRLASMARCR